MTPTREESAFCFPCGSASLVGILHGAEPAAGRGVLVVVGGPQYRVGSHRQFLLLARAFAASGIPCMRFDHRGIGDSEGSYGGFEALDEDIGAAVDAFFARCPGLREVVLWGLCDGASAILFYAGKDPRVAGVTLLNPWVRTEESEARTYLRHYYLGRLFEAEFWRHVARGGFRPLEALSSIAGMIKRQFSAGRPAGEHELSLPERMALGLKRFKGPVLLIISGRDLTAREFEDSAARSALWRELLADGRVTRQSLPEADHTFSRRAWRDQVADWSLNWMRSW